MLGSRLLLTIACLAVCVGATVGCRTGRATASGVDITLSVDRPMVVGQPIQVVVTLADATGAPIVGARVEVEGNMRHAGMVPVLARAIETEPGRYVVDGFAFTMEGEWILTGKATLPDGRKAERSIDPKDVPAVCGPTPPVATPTR